MKRAFVVFLAIAVLCGYSAESPADGRIVVDETQAGDFSLGFNVAGTLAYGMLASAYDTALIAIPLESNIRISDYVGISASIHYAYLTSDMLHLNIQGNSRDINFTADDAHQIFFGIGPRISLSGSGLEGWYALIQFAFVYSEASGEENYLPFPNSIVPRDVVPMPTYRSGSEPSVNRIDLGLRPEIGYAFSFGRPGFYLSMGVGMRILFTVYCDPPPAESHESSSFDYLLIYTPMINLTLGFDI